MPRIHKYTHKIPWAARGAHCIQIVHSSARPYSDSRNYLSRFIKRTSSVYSHTGILLHVFLFLQMAVTFPPPFKDTSQRRKQRRRATGPHTKVCFHIKTLCKPFISFCFILFWHFKCPRKLSALSVSIWFAIPEGDIIEAAWFILYLEF